MQEQSLFATDTETSSTNSVFSSFIFHRDEGCLYFNKQYQRPYCWGEKEQQSLLQTIFAREPIDSVAVVINHDSDSEYFEVVDGRQRITTMLKFFDGEIPFITESGAKVYFNDLPKFDQLEFKKLTLPTVELKSRDGSPVSLVSKLRFFYRKNFAGVPQSQDHKAKIELMMGGI
ncbi:DUF262 domain-containing protein [Vibrio coralliirubri]|uniref:DUF262 domain-containing protein n=1 Tax=Vibrio coralliirubri TaxID=1516159 RepID=UPI0022844794|nr:DUF262 domain-containing protein [Vibrio coralliirubri]MCY9861428.1 DUF262 domain-containing protein [Vibrio coralliirubri]